jgi:hypothetical protein
VGDAIALSLGACFTQTRTPTANKGRGFEKLARVALDGSVLSGVHRVDSQVAGSSVEICKRNMPPLCFFGWFFS